MPGYVDRLGITVEFRGMLVDPRHSPADLIDHRHQAATGCLDIDEVENNRMGARSNEELTGECRIRRSSGPPRTAVDEDVDGRLRCACFVDIQGLVRSGAVVDTRRRSY